MDRVGVYGPNGLVRRDVQTLFELDSNGLATNKATPGCEWVASEDVTAIMIAEDDTIWADDFWRNAPRDFEGLRAFLVECNARDYFAGFVFCRTPADKDGAALRFSQNDPIPDDVGLAIVRACHFGIT